MIGEYRPCDQILVHHAFYLMFVQLFLRQEKARDTYGFVHITISKLKLLRRLA